MRIRNGSFPACWLVLFTMFWPQVVGVAASCCLPPKVAAAHAHSLTDAQRETEHRKHCHCVSCPGVDRCCCVTPGGTASLLMPAVCDNGAPLASTPAPPAAPVRLTLSAALCWIPLPRPAAPRSVPALALDAPSPLGPPPRSV